MILCCGEALIDMIPVSGADGAMAFEPHTGGAVFNTSIALGRLGVEAGLMTGMSSDLFGRQLMQALAESHVDVRYVMRSDRPSTLAFVELTDGHAEYAFFDENSAGRMVRLEDMPALAAPEADGGVAALFLGGISLTSEPSGAAYAALLAREGADRAVMMDPNIRAGFITDEAEYRARLSEMMAQVDMVKVSDEDLGWLGPVAGSGAPGTGDLADLARGILDLGPAIVIVTRGGDGAVGYMAGGAEVSVPARRVEVVDTVGAGDSYNAGVMAHLQRRGVLTKAGLRGLSVAALEEAMGYGAQVAAVTVSRQGANPPWAEMLEG